MVQTSPSVLKCLVALLPRFPARRQAVGGGIQNVQGPEVPASGSWAGVGWGRRAARGPSEGIVGVGCLGWGGSGGLRAADKATAPPRSVVQWNEWAINSGQWEARVAPLKSRGSAERPLFACAAP